MANPLNILMFSPFYPPHMGGLELHAQQWSQEMQKRGHTITIVTSQLPKAAASQERLDGISIVRIPCVEIIPGYPLPAIWQARWWQIWKDLRAEKPDIIISRTRFFFTTILAALVRRRAKAWVHIEHGSDYVHLHHLLLDYTAKKYDHLVSRFILPSANAIIGNSQASAQFIRKLNAQLNPTVLYRGVPVREIQTIEADENLRHTLKDMVILTFIGRLMPGKGVSDLLQSIAKLPHLPFHLCIVGDGPERSILEKIIREKHLENKVTMFGQLSHKRSLAIMKASDIIILPSYTEGFPSVLLEAAIAGRAILATNVGGTSEIVRSGSSGLLYDAGDINACSQHIENLVHNPAMREAYGQQAQKDALEKFAWPTIAASYENLFYSLIKNE